jgi:hypothetical protein
LAFEVQSYLTTTSTSTSTNLINDLLWYDDGLKIYVQPHNFLEFHDLNLDQANPIAHFFNPYISLNLETFEVIPNVFVEDFFGDPNFEAFVLNFDPNYESILFNVINPNDEAIRFYVVDPKFKAIVFYIVDGLVINILSILNQFQSFVFLTLMKEIDNVKGGH